MGAFRTLAATFCVAMALAVGVGAASDGRRADTGKATADMARAAAAADGPPARGDEPPAHGME